MRCGKCGVTGIEEGPCARCGHVNVTPETWEEPGVTVSQGPEEGIIVPAPVVSDSVHADNLEAPAPSHLERAKHHLGEFFNALGEAIGEAVSNRNER